MSVSDEATFHYDVFVSYAGADKAWVSKSFVPALEAAGLRVCVFPRDQHVGKPKIEDLEDSILGSRHTVLVLSPEFVNSEWQAFSGSLVQTIDVAARDERVIPLLRKECDLPHRIDYLTPADFTTLDEVDLTWRKLLIALDAPNVDYPTPKITPPYDDQLAPKPRPERPAKPDRPKRPVSKTLKQLLGSPLWQGIGGIVAILALGATLTLANNGQNAPTPTPTATPTATLTVTPTNTPTATASATATAVSTSTPSVTPTAMPTEVPSATPTDTPVPTDIPPTATVPPTPDLWKATANFPAGIDTAPNGDQVDYVLTGQTVTVLGRAYSGTWLYVQTVAGTKGFAFLTLFDWPGDFQSLKPIPVPATATPTHTITPAATPSSDYVGIDFYTTGDGFCSPKAGYHLYLRGLGEMSPFKYYVDGVPKYEGSDQYTFDFDYPSGTVLVRVVARVEARDGRWVEKALALRKPNCP